MSQPIGIDVEVNYYDEMSDSFDEDMTDFVENVPNGDENDCFAMALQLEEERRQQRSFITSTANKSTARKDKQVRIVNILKKNIPVLNVIVGLTQLKQGEWAKMWYGC